jgi:hypothetical protein
MKIRELVKPTDWQVPENIPPIQRDKTANIVAPMQIPIRLLEPKERSGSPDIFPHADPEDSMTGNHAPDVNRLPTRSASLSMPHAPDLDLIKTQIAQLPRRGGQ